MKIKALMILLHLSIFCYADDNDAHSRVQLRLDEIMAMMSQDPKAALESFDTFFAEQQVQKYPLIYAEALRAKCFSELNLGMFGEARDTAEIGLEILPKNSQPFEQVRFLICVAGYHIGNSEFLDASKLYEVAIEKSGDDVELKAFSLQYRAKLYSDQGIYAKAIDDLMTAHDLYSSNPRLERQQNAVLMNIGLIYHRAREYKLSLEFLERALKFYSDSGNDFVVARILHNQGMNAFELGDFSKAKDRLTLSLAKNLKLRNEKLLFDNYIMLGKLHLAEQDVMQASVDIENAQRLSDKSDSVYEKNEVLLLKARALLLGGRYRAANEVLKHASAEVSMVHEQKLTYIQLKMELNVKLGLFDEAFVQAQRLLEIERNAFNSAMKNEVAQLAFEHAITNARSENQILRLRAENSELQLEKNKTSNMLYRSFSVSAGIVLLIVSGLSIALFRKNKLIERLMLTDELTKMPNRRAIISLLEQQTRFVRRYDFDCVVGIIDVDHFKSINDRFGHPFGDEVLIQIANICTSQLRDSDYFGRLGGEEFMVILPNTDSRGALQILERLRSKVAEHVFSTSEFSIRSSISIGAYHLLKDDDADSAYNIADKALYDAKQTGRNKVIFAKNDR